MRDRPRGLGSRGATFTKNVIPVDTFGAVRDGHVGQHYLCLDPHFVLVLIGLGSRSSALDRI